MKRPQPNISDTLRSTFIGDLATVRKLKRYWGTTSFNGVEVMVPRQYWHKPADRSETFEKLYKFLGAYEDVIDAKTKGINRAWLYFNKNKATDLPEVDARYENFVAGNLNALWWDPADGAMPSGLTLTTAVIIEAQQNTTGSTPVAASIINQEMTQEERIQAVLDNYDTLWSTCTITQEGVGVINKGSITDPNTRVVTADEDDLTPDDPWLNTLARYALRSNGVPCTIKKVEIGLGSTEVKALYPTYVVTIEIPYTQFLTTSGIVVAIANDLETNYTFAKNPFAYMKLALPNGYRTQSIIKAMDSTDIEENANVVTRPYTLWEDYAVHVDSTLNNLWVQDNKKWYLKAEVFDDPRKYGLTHRKLTDYVLPLIDSDYKKKSATYLQKIAAVIVAVVLTIYLGPEAGLKGAALITAWAGAIALTALILQIVTIAASAMGLEGLSSAFGWLLKELDPLITVAQVVYIVGSIYQKAAEAAAEKALQEAGKEVTKEAVMAAAGDLTIQEVLSFALNSAGNFSLKEFLENQLTSFLDNLSEGYSDLVSAKLSNASIQFTDKLVQLLTLPAKLKIESLNARTKDMLAEYEQMQKEAQEQEDILRGFLNISPRPATADWSIYAEVFDMPYERGGGTLALGNIQRTTKQALRKAPYTDPVFDGILLI